MKELLQTLDVAPEPSQLKVFTIVNNQATDLANVLLAHPAVVELPGFPVAVESKPVLDPEIIDSDVLDLVHAGRVPFQYFEEETGLHRGGELPANEKLP